MSFHLIMRRIQLLFGEGTTSNQGADVLLNLTVAKSFQALYGGTVYQALLIPDTGGRGSHVLHALLLTDRELYIFSVQGMSGIVRSDGHGIWRETDSNGNVVQHPNAVTQLQDKADVLAQYITRRGVPLPKDFLKLRVVFVDAMARPEQEILLLPEVLSYDRWEAIQKETSSSGTSPSTRRSSVASPNNQLHYILSTAPTWDRLELRGGAIFFGDFLRFKGPLQAVEALAVVKRSKISQYQAIHTWSFCDCLGIHEVKVVCSLRDHRQGSSVQRTKIEIPVRGDVEIIFQAEGTTMPCAYELRDVLLLSLHA